jgi:hypothetical protein
VGHGRHAGDAFFGIAPIANLNPEWTYPSMFEIDSCRLNGSKGRDGCGAALEIASPIGIPDEFTLVIAADKVRRRCVVVWRKQKRIGVAFY